MTTKNLTVRMGIMWDLLKMYLEEKRTADSQHTSGTRKTSTKGAYAWHLTYPRGEITEWRHSAVSQDFSFWAVFAMWFRRINPESCAPLRRWCCLAGGLSLPQRHMADKDGTGTGTDRGVVARVQLHIWNKVMYSRHQVDLLRGTFDDYQNILLFP